MAKKKADKIDYFVQLGMKKNGRIVKNEEFPLELLYETVIDMNYKQKLELDVNWFARLFQWKHAQRILKAEIDRFAAELQFQIAGDALAEMIGLIDSDQFGKKPKKAKK